MSPKQQLKIKPAYFLQNVLNGAVKVVMKELEELGETENLFEKATEIMFRTSKNKSKVYEFEQHGVIYPFTYKELLEGMHVCYFCYGVSKNSGGEKRFEIAIDDSPDIVMFGNDGSVQGLEVTEKYDHLNHDKEHTEINVEKEVRDLWNLKGRMSYGVDTDLLVPYKGNIIFNLGDFFEETKKYIWPFKYIILGIHRIKESSWEYYLLNLKEGKISYLEPIYINSAEDKKFLY